MATFIMHIPPQWVHGMVYHHGNKDKIFKEGLAHDQVIHQVLNFPHLWWTTDNPGIWTWQEDDDE